MKKKLIVSDTNIFFDLYKVGLLKEFFSLPYEIKTTMLVFSEIKDPNQLQVIKPFVDSGKLKIERIDDDVFIKCLSLSLTTPGDLSIPDCSVWQTAKKLNAKMLTNDKNLRKAAEKDNVEVHGLFFTFDEMLKHKIIDKNCAISETKKLMTTNRRFPKKIAEMKIKEWESIPPYKKTKKCIFARGKND